MNGDIAYGGWHSVESKTTFRRTDSMAEEGRGREATRSGGRKTGAHVEEEEVVGGRKVVQRKRYSRFVEVELEWI